MMINPVKYQKIVLLTLVLMGGFLQSKGQEAADEIEGIVSYITSSGVYVRFENTQEIEIGDTLFLQKQSESIPVLVVQQRSSISCLCKKTGEHLIKVGDTVIGRISKKEPEKEIMTAEGVEQDLNEQVLISSGKEKQQKTSDVSGQLRVSSYSNFSNSSLSENYHRLRYTFAMDAMNISGSRLSAETYISFSHKLNEWDVVQDNLNNALKIYSLALKYDFNKTATIWAGRKINPKIANVGAVDGIQFQKQWKQIFAGLVVGSRPDYLDYGFNPDLLEYGAYLGHNTKMENGFIQSSLAFFEQRNSGNIDRRFVYFQHSNSFFRNVNIFSSFELDLYKLENNEPQNTVSLTSLYFSLRYKVSRQLSLFGSYDNRGNVIYYETFKNYADQILQLVNRQGLRFRINYRPLKYLNLGANAGTCSRKTDPRPTNTIAGYATYTRIPKINASFTLSSNLMQTSYLDGQVYGARLSKDLIPGKVFATLNYRRVNFDYINTSTQLKQNIGEIDLSFQFNKKLYLSVNYEATFQDNLNYNRIYLNLRKKF